MKATRRHDRGGARRTAGFSLIELLVVIGIIAVMASLSLPAISRYIRLYKIRGGQQQVAGQIQFARSKAINKNVNRGMSFVVQSPTAYWVHIEDDQSTAHSAAAQTLNFGTPVAIQSTRFELPLGVQFGANATQCPDIAGFAPNAGYVRFNRLGAACAAACGATPTTGTPPATVIWNSANGSALCVFQPSTGLSRTINIAPGGRVVTQQ